MTTFKCQRSPSHNNKHGIVGTKINNNVCFAKMHRMLSVRIDGASLPAQPHLGSRESPAERLLVLASGSYAMFAVVRLPALAEALSIPLPALQNMLDVSYRGSSIDSVLLLRWMRGCSGTEAIARSPALELIVPQFPVLAASAASLAES